MPHAKSFFSRLGYFLVSLWKPALITTLAILIDMRWLSKQAWYADMPLSGYAFEQKQLQESYLQEKKTSSVFLVDISQTLPSLATTIRERGTTKDTSEDQVKNYQGLGQLVATIAACKPKAIVIDWDIAPDSESIQRKNGKPVFLKHHEDLFVDIDKIVQSGTKVYFGANRAIERRPEERFPVSRLAPYAVSLSIPDPSVGPYYATGRTETEEGLKPLAVAVAHDLVAPKTPDDTSLWNQHKWLGFSSVPHSEEKEHEPETYWINYEAVPGLIRDAFTYSSLTGNRTGFDPQDTNDKKAREMLKGKVVVLGDLQGHGTDDIAVFPLTETCYKDPKRFLGDAFAKQTPSALHRQMVIAGGAGVLHQASALHTLLNRPLYSASSLWTEIICAFLWAFLWFLVTEKIADILLRKLGINKHDAHHRAELHAVAIDLVFGTALGAFCLLQIAGAVSRHYILIPLVAAMVMASLSEIVLNVFLLLIREWFPTLDKHIKEKTATIQRRLTRKGTTV
jgi:hypothetical protein